MGSTTNCTWDQVTAIEKIAIDPAQLATFVIIMIAEIAEIATASQLLATTRAEIIIPNFVTNHGPLLVVIKGQTMITTAIFIRLQMEMETKTFLDSSRL